MPAGRARHRPGHAEREAADVHRVHAVDVLVGVDVMSAASKSICGGAGYWKSMASTAGSSLSSRRRRRLRPGWRRRAGGGGARRARARPPSPASCGCSRRWPSRRRRAGCRGPGCARRRSASRSAPEVGEHRLGHRPPGHHPCRHRCPASVTVRPARRAESTGGGGPAPRPHCRRHRFSLDIFINTLIHTGHDRSRSQPLPPRGRRGVDAALAPPATGHDVDRFVEDHGTIPGSKDGAWSATSPRWVALGCSFVDGVVVPRCSSPHSGSGRSTSRSLWPSSSLPGSWPNSSPSSRWNRPAGRPPYASLDPEHPRSYVPAPLRWATGICAAGT